MQDKKEITSLLDVLKWFDENPNEQFFNKTPRKYFYKLAIKNANDVLSKGKIVEDRDIDTAREVLNKFLAENKKVEPVSSQIAKLEKHVKDFGLSEEQAKKFKEFLVEKNKYQVVLRPEDVKQAAIKFGLNQGAIDTLPIPREPFLLTETPISDVVVVYQPPTQTEVSLQQKSESAFPTPPPPAIPTKNPAGQIIKSGATKQILKAVASGAGGPMASALSAVQIFAKKNKIIHTLAGAGAGSLLVLPLGLSPVLGAFAGGTLGYTAAGAGGIGGAIGAVGTGVAAFISALGAATIGAIAVPLTVALVATPIIIAIILFIINSGAYIVPPSDNLALSQFGIGATVQSPYIDIKKTAEPKGPFENSDLTGGLVIRYKVTISAKKGSLTNISITDSCKTIKEKASPACPPQSKEIPTVETISPTTPFEFDYERTFTAGFEDSFVTDTILVTADTPDQKGAQAVGSATIKIGEPPEDCPSGWPVAKGTVVNGPGPGGISTHRDLEAIDIDTNNQLIPVYATHRGIVKVEQTEYSGKYVIIESICDGVVFTSNYIHLSSVIVTNETEVTKGQQIGDVGASGSSAKGYVHLHYDFRLGNRFNRQRGIILPPLFPHMGSPYIPNDVKRTCSDALNNPCGVSF